MLIKIDFHEKMMLSFALNFLGRGVIIYTIYMQSTILIFVIVVTTFQQ